jgi:prepilin-type N-terminal cleavage/methylation domain-containing protein
MVMRHACSSTQLRAPHHKQRLKSSSGFSILELLTVIGLISILSALTVSRLNQGFATIDGAASELRGNLRLARLKAVAEGYHYRIQLTSSSVYQLSRLLPPTPPATAWTAVDNSQIVRTVTLPSNVFFNNIGYPLTYEFDSRGTMISSNALITLILSQPGRTLNVFLFPSGQVA